MSSLWTTVLLLSAVAVIFASNTGLNHLASRDDDPGSKQASIWRSSRTDPTIAATFHCTSTIVSRRHVLTTNYCANSVNKDNVLVSEATGDLNDSLRFSRVESIVRNTEYDLAIFTVEDSFFLQASVMGLAKTSPAIGDDCTASGWWTGSSDVDEEDMSYVSNEDCKTEYQGTQSPLKDIHVCSKVKQGEQHCSIGLGWPLVCDGQVVGVFTWTHFSCSLPDVYTSIEKSSPWITSVTASAHAPVASVSVVLMISLGRIFIP